MQVEWYEYNRAYFVNHDWIETQYKNECTALITYLSNCQSNMLRSDSSLHSKGCSPAHAVSLLVILQSGNAYRPTDVGLHSLRMVVWIGIWLDGRMDGRMARWMKSVFGRFDRWIDEWLCGWVEWWEIRCMDTMMMIECMAAVDWSVVYSDDFMDLDIWIEI